MAITLKRTSAVEQHFVKGMVFGTSGVGKTTLLPSLPNPVVLSAEAGLLSIRGADLPYIQISSMEDLADAFLWCRDSDEAKKFDAIGIDSLSEVAEVVLSSEKKKASDPRQAYGATQDKIADLVRAFLDLPCHHVWMIAKVERTQDESGRLLYNPMMPGNKLAQMVPYWFDFLLPRRAEQTETGIVRMLQTGTDGVWNAKDRSGRLDMWEPADLGAIIKKVQG